MANSYKKDNLFQNDIGKQFEFDADVALVFDDMADRSIPYYRENIELISYFIRKIAHQKSNLDIYDLGSSTANLLLELSSIDELKNANLVGIDSSSAMIEKSTKKAEAYGREIKFICSDFLDIDISSADIIIANYTMQFIRPAKRTDAIKKIYDSLKTGGVFFMSEKVSSINTMLDRYMIERYHQYKIGQGYTMGEITKKREALENILVPYTMQENLQMLKDTGFSTTEILLKWINFTTFASIK